MSYSFAYNNGSSPSGTTKFAKLQIGGNNREYTTYGNLDWYASAPYNGKFLIVSDTYSQGWTNQESATPTFWRSANNTLDSLKDLVNQLPDVNGVTGFTDVGGAINYINSTDKYLISQESDSYNEGDIVTNGLVLNLDAGYSNSYPKSGTTWYDMSGTNNGTLTNGPTFSGDSIVFDGVDDYVNIPSLKHPTYTNNFTFNAWVKLTGNGTRYYGIGGWGDSGKNPYYVWGVGINNFKFRTQIFNGSNYYVESDTIEPNVWYNVHFVVYQTGLMELYINLTKYTSTGNNPLIRSRDINDIWNRTHLGIGANSQFGEMQGNIELSTIYNRALSATEVLQNYNAQKGRFGL